MIYNNIEAEDFLIGKNTIIAKSAKIRGINGKAKKITPIFENINIK